ncbi:Hypothetical predicted protein [Marmota monax]|uniref:Uncharacterized protein n=1 Tax=Marmota monax TaxID=9995 RepID=A0A5E4DD57_MARMO|nr:Hypothetical predicted protein [Marmota monax]
MEYEDGETVGSDMRVCNVIWPTPSSHTTDSELTMPTRHQDTWSMEEPALGPSLSEGVNTSEEEREDHWRSGESKQGELGPGLATHNSRAANPGSAPNPASLGWPALKHY